MENEKNMTNRKEIRVGIDVGGTHTKAVAIDNQTHEIIGKFSVKTTHSHKLGVSAGVVQAFTGCLDKYKIDASCVVFVAHSTTQATNALLEGDVAHVGVLGVYYKGLEGFLAKRQMRLKDISLGTGRKIAVSSACIEKSKLTKDEIAKIVHDFTNKGVRVIVTTSPFGVDNLEDEHFVADCVKEEKVLVTAASEVSKLYGLTRRTKTAVINASILPKMLEVADCTMKAVADAGVLVPLMIMRGDGGSMDIKEMKKRPILTMLSGPAASIMGALMYLRVSNGIYFEVGGTSTNIGVIKNGRPAIDYSVVDGLKTSVTSIDITVLGVAGGSMVRASSEGVIDVGPRSAHIAGLDYASFTKEEEIVNPVLEFFSPKEGDPADYIAIRLQNGKRITITTTCAANVLGYAKPGDFSYGNVNSARKAMQVVAEYMNVTVEEVAEQILAKAADKIAPVILELLSKYKLDKSHIAMIGVGGGVASIIGYVAKRMEITYKIPEHAEVISSIGVALSLIRECIERTIPSPTQNDIKKIRKEVIAKVIENGAEPDSVDVHIEVDNTTSKLIAIATGAAEVKTTDLLKECSIEEAKELAAADMNLMVSNVTLAEASASFYIFTGRKEEKHYLRIVDKKGFIRVQRNEGMYRKVKASEYRQVVKEIYEKMSVYLADCVLRPDFYLCVGPRIMDFDSGTELEQNLMLMEVTIQEVSEDEEIIIIGVKNAI